jgi:hypothetical protein
MTDITLSAETENNHGIADEKRQVGDKKESCTEVTVDNH